MMEKEIRLLFYEFNYMVNNLLNAFTRNNLDEDSLIFLSKSTKHLLSFTYKILLKIVFKLFGGLNLLKFKINEDIIDIDKMVEIIYKQIYQSLDDMLSQKVDKKRRKDMDVVVDYLILLKNIINKLANLVISVLKYQTDVINEDEFRKKYRTFKYDIIEDKQDLEKKLNIKL